MFTFIILIFIMNWWCIHKFWMIKLGLNSYNALMCWLIHYIEKYEIYIHKLMCDIIWHILLYKIEFCPRESFIQIYQTVNLSFLKHIIAILWIQFFLWVGCWSRKNVSLFFRRDESRCCAVDSPVQSKNKARLFLSTTNLYIF